jgi:hypothetical protein
MELSQRSSQFMMVMEELVAVTFSEITFMSILSTIKVFLMIQRKPLWKESIGLKPNLFNWPKRNS